MGPGYCAYNYLAAVAPSLSICACLRPFPGLEYQGRDCTRHFMCLPMVTGRPNLMAQESANQRVFRWLADDSRHTSAGKLRLRPLYRVEGGRRCGHAWKAHRERD